MELTELDRKIADVFPDVSVNKAVSRRYGGGDRPIPDFVTDWLVCRYAHDGDVDDSRIEAFLARHLPDKKHKQSVLFELNAGAEMKILDAYSVKVDIATGRLRLEIPCLDISDAAVDEEIISRSPLLLHGNVWGSGTLIRAERPDDSGKYEVRMLDFKPMQTSVVDLDYYIAQRSQFTTDEWGSLLVGSMGYSPDFYNPRQRQLLLTRMAPLVQSRVNLIELAPKGTGKSHVFSRLSRYAWLISGGVVTRAQLFYNMQSRTAGVITRFDAVVLDEIQTIRLGDEGEIVGALKGYLEQGEFRVMQFKGSADAGFVLLANIPIAANSRPRDEDLFRTLPSWLRGENATALIDRFHGLLPGWELPKISQGSLHNGLGLRADYLGEVLHALRGRGEYLQWVRDNTQTDKADNTRDVRAVERLAAAYLKLFFPDLNGVTPEEFDMYCLEPARSMRARIRKQLALMDDEYDDKLAGIRSHQVVSDIGEPDSLWRGTDYEE